MSNAPRSHVEVFPLTPGADNVADFSFAPRSERDSVDQISHCLEQLRLSTDPSLHGIIDALGKAQGGFQRANLGQQGLPQPSFAPQGLDTASSPRQGFQRPSSRDGAMYRETDTITLPALPQSVMEMRQWAIEVSHAVQAASGRG